MTCRRGNCDCRCSIQPIFAARASSCPLQALAETRKPTHDFLTRLAEVEAREKLNALCVNRYGVTEFELRSAAQAIRHKLTTCSKSSIDAFKRVDLNDSGTLSLSELKTFMRDMFLEHIVNDRTLNALCDCIDTEGDGEFDYREFIKLIESEDIAAHIPPEGAVKKKSQKMIDAETPIGVHGCSVADLKFAQTTIKERLLMINRSIIDALRDVDEDGSGIITREEMKAFLREYRILKYTDTYGSGSRVKVSAHAPPLVPGAGRP